MNILDVFTDINFLIQLKFHTRIIKKFVHLYFMDMALILLLALVAERYYQFKSNKELLIFCY